MTESPTGAIGAFVRRRRKANHLTQAQLAALAGVGVRFLSELERGKPTARVDAVDAVLRVFGKRVGIVDAAAGDADREPVGNGTAGTLGGIDRG